MLLPPPYYFRYLCYHFVTSPANCSERSLVSPPCLRLLTVFSLPLKMSKYGYIITYPGKRDNWVSLWKKIRYALKSDEICTPDIPDAVKTSIYIYMVPVIIVVTSVLILHEQITTLAITRTALTPAGLFLSEGKFYFYPFYFHRKWRQQHTGSLLQSPARMPDPYIVTPKVFKISS